MLGEFVVKSNLIDPITTVKFREECVASVDQSLKQWLSEKDWSYRTWTDSPGTYHAPHDHPYSHRVLVRSGRIEFTVNERTYELTSGDALDLPAGVEHEARSTPDKPTEYWLLQSNSQ